jgi:hypothetical protein
MPHPPPGCISRFARFSTVRAAVQAAFSVHAIAQKPPQGGGNWAIWRRVLYVSGATLQVGQRLNQEKRLLFAVCRRRRIDS